MQSYMVTLNLNAIQITYDTVSRTASYKERTFFINLGKKTYKPVVGYLLFPKSVIEHINFVRKQTHLSPLYSAEEVLDYVLDNKLLKYLKRLQFLALGLLNVKNLIYEDSLLEKIGYICMPKYFFNTLEDARKFIADTGISQNEFFKQPIIASLQPFVYGAAIYNDFELIEANIFEGYTKTRPITSCTPIMDRLGRLSFFYKISPIGFIDQIIETINTPFYFEKELPLMAINGDLKPDCTQAMTYDACPFCGKKLFQFQLLENRRYPICLNAFCKEKILKKALHLSNKDVLDIKGFSPYTLERIYNYLLPNQAHITAFKLLNITSEKVLELPNIYKEQLELLNQSLKKSRNKPLWQYIKALEISGLSAVKAKEIAHTFDDNFELFLNACYAQNTCSQRFFDIDFSDYLIKLENFYNFSNIK